MHNTESLEIKIIDEVGQEKLSDLTSDYAELSLDFFMENDTLKDIPFFGTFFKIYKTANNITDQIFLKKLYSFLFHLKEIPLNKRIAFIDNLEESKQKVGEKLLILIEKLDDLDKPKIISNLFKATIEEKMTYEDFLIISNSVSNSYINDLKELRNDIIELEIQERLSHNGIFAISLNIDSTNRYRNSNVIRRRDGPNEISSTPHKKQVSFHIKSVNDNNRMADIRKQQNEQISIELNFVLTSLGEKLIEICFR